ncbi:alpha/beta fold hydrolase [Streptomyces spinosirectus]|jgi:predicted dienelactone hydrolase|uniref:alpha/beta hydrolase family protein n=1 Tax=Streptomyces TaxID=1883 RepID=UPI001C9D6C05|nr:MULTISPECIES: alpha/beta fold hydrolase [Streptomyces]MBY8341255.1 alpha/beta fold hydrolase [Streptomyces plumbidurans]UIR19101.1 alpha/beta fold hydrolase [Streptomyces spinosirectus]
MTDHSTTAPHDLWDEADALQGSARTIPVAEATPFMSVNPVVLPAPGRPAPLHVRVSAPTTGEELPIVLFSHGGGFTNYIASNRGFSPLADFWAAHGFVVVQPTHLSSKSLGLPRTAPDARAYWESRVEDLTAVLDHFDRVEAAVPGLAGRADLSRVAVAGHSMGGQSASMLLGAGVEENGEKVRRVDDRIKAGVLLAATGAGGDHLTEMAARFTALRTARFDEMATPTLVVVGDQDHAPELTSRGAAYHADAYHQAPGPKSLLTLHGGEHMLGGITGYDTTETTDENPERVAVIQRMTWAFLRGALAGDSEAWRSAASAFGDLQAIGRLESK